MVETLALNLTFSPGEKEEPSSVSCLADVTLSLCAFALKFSSVER